MGSSKKATAANFADQVQRILDEYGDDVRDNVEEITKAVSKKAGKEVKGASGIFGGSGKYARGWTVTSVGSASISLMCCPLVLCTSSIFAPQFGQ